MTFLCLLKGSYRPDVSRKGCPWHFWLSVEIVAHTDVDSLLKMPLRVYEATGRRREGE